MTPSLSIIIPTRNRAEQCAKTVVSVLAFPGDFELVLFDSSETDELAGHLPPDPRVRIVKGSPAFNMTQCFEAAVAEARGDFVCMIGDDDGVTPQLFAWVEQAALEGLHSVTTDPDYFAMYNWPGLKSRYFGDANTGKLFLKQGTGAERTADLAAERSAFLANGGQGCGPLPRVYHGLVRRSLLEAMRARFGRCFDGVSPDVSFSYFAALLERPHKVIDKPLAISGQSLGSNAGRSAMREHKGDLWSDPHMQRYRGVHWPADVPQFFSVETVWGQATLSAVEVAGGAERGQFGFARYYARLLVAHPDKASETLSAVDSNPAVGRARLAASAAAEVARTGSTIVRKLWRKAIPDRSVEVLVAPGIIEASRLAAERLPAGPLAAGQASSVQHEVQA
jgi:glycosyltransferase involved in cell wall biosynthesis